MKTWIHMLNEMPNVEAYAQYINGTKTVTVRSPLLNEPMVHYAINRLTAALEDEYWDIKIHETTDEYVIKLGNAKKIKLNALISSLSKQFGIKNFKYNAYGGSKTYLEFTTVKDNKIVDELVHLILEELFQYDALVTSTLGTTSKIVFTTELIKYTIKEYTGEWAPLLNRLKNKLTETQLEILDASLSALLKQTTVLQAIETKTNNIIVTAISTVPNSEVPGLVEITDGILSQAGANHRVASMNNMCTHIWEVA